MKVAVVAVAVLGYGEEEHVSIEALQETVLGKAGVDVLHRHVVGTHELVRDRLKLLVAKGRSINARLLGDVVDALGRISLSTVGEEEIV